MESFDRVLDGLEVAVDAVAGAGSATLRFARDRILLVPPRLHGSCTEVDSRLASHRAHEGQVVIHFRATCFGSVGVFDQLRVPLVVDLAADGVLRASFESLLDEVDGHRAGWRAMRDALLRQCLILTLRRCAERSEPMAWLPCLEDQGLGRALSAMRERPEHGFTLASLADIARMSRSVFAARFADAMDVPPMEFLARVRLARAAQLLAATELPVKMVAGRVGYLSRSSFTRAFLARHGVGPRAYRAAGRAGDRQSGRSPLTVRPLRGKTRVSAPPSGAIARDWNDRTPEAVSF